MGLVGFKGQNHPQQTGKRGALDQVDDRGTDPALFAELADRFGGFDLDVAAATHNAKCARWYSIEDEGLRQPWRGRVWCNPPYSDLAAWCGKAWEEWSVGRPSLIVMLVPASRTEQAWWQDHIEPYRDRPGSPLRTEHLRGRRRFVRPGRDAIGPNERPPFGSALLIWSAPNIGSPTASPPIIRGESEPLTAGAGKVPRRRRSAPDIARSES
jgi:phage N-6-adenine-methyltransferase